MFLVVIDSDHIILSTMLLLAGEKVERLSRNLVFMALSVEQRLLYFQKRTAIGTAFAELFYQIHATSL